MLNTALFVSTGYCKDNYDDLSTPPVPKSRAYEHIKLEPIELSLRDIPQGSRSYLLVVVLGGWIWLPDRISWQLVCLACLQVRYNHGTIGNSIPLFITVIRYCQRVGQEYTNRKRHGAMQNRIQQRRKESKVVKLISNQSVPNHGHALTWLYCTVLWAGCSCLLYTRLIYQLTWPTNAGFLWSPSAEPWMTTMCWSSVNQEIEDDD